jgi:hypothetical protein
MSAHINQKLVWRIEELHLENPTIDSCVRPITGTDFNKATNIQQKATSILLSSNSIRVGKVIRIYVCSHENDAR